MSFVSVFDILQNLQRLVGRCRFKYHLLKSSFQCAIFLNAVAIFVERGGTNALYRAPSQCRLHNIGRIHATRCATSANDGVYLVDKDDDVGIIFNLFKQSANTFFKLSAVFSASHHARHIQTNNAFIEEHRRGFAFGNELSQPFNDSTFAHARFANDDGIVLFSSTKNFCYAQNLPFSTHHGVESVLHGRQCKVGRKTIEDGCFAVSFSRLGGLSAFVSLLCVVSVQSFFVLVFRETETILRWHGSFLKESQSIFVIDVVIFEHFFCRIVHAVVQHSQQKMLHIHSLCVLYASL